MFSIYWFFFIINIFFFFSNFLIFFVRFNIILVLIFIEIGLFFVNLNFLIISIFYNDIIGYLFSIFIVSMAGAEVSIGLIFLIIYYKINEVLYINNLSLLKS